MADFFSRLFGEKPSVPKWTSLDLGKEQGKSIANNQANLPAAEALTSSANLFSEQQMNQMLSAVGINVPGMGAEAGANIESMLKGEIPADVSGAVTRSAAAKALGGGYAGSGAAGDLVARDLGLTSLELTQQGLSSLEGWMGAVDKIYAPGMINAASMFISPAQEATFDTQERNMSWEDKWLQAQVHAMPDPRVQGTWDMASSFLGGLSGGLLNTSGSDGGGGGGGGIGGLLGMLL